MSKANPKNKLDDNRIIEMRFHYQDSSWHGRENR